MKSMNCESAMLDTNDLFDCMQEAVDCVTRLSRIFPLTKFLGEALVLLEAVGFIQEEAHDIHYTAPIY